MHVAVIMNYYQNISQKELYLASSLYDSVEDNDFKAVETLLKRTANPNILLPDKGISSFHLAIGIDSARYAKEVTALFLQNSGDPNVRSEDGLTPVHIAAAWGRSDILDLLLRCGGDPTVLDLDNQNALDYAISENFVNTATIITRFLSTVQYPEGFVDRTPCQITLDKIVINNGTVVAEYEASRNRTPSNALSHIPSDLSHNNDYIREWCQTAGLINSGTDRATIKIRQKIQQPTDDSDYSTSVKTTPSPSPSCASIPEPSFHVTRPKQTIKSQCRVIRLDPTNDIVLSRKKLGRNPPAKNTVQEIAASSSLTLDASSLSSKNDSSCRESGVMTLPADTTHNFTGQQPNAFWTPALPRDESDSNPSFFTCEGDASNRSLNELEVNVFAVDYSNSLITLDESISSAFRLRSRDVNDESVTKRSAAAESVLSAYGSVISVSSTAESVFSVAEEYRYTDKDNSVELIEKRMIVTDKSPSDNSSAVSPISSKLSTLPSSFEYDTDTLRKELMNGGCAPGPINNSTKRLYLRKLRRIQKDDGRNYSTDAAKDVNAITQVFSNELERTFRDPSWANDLTFYKSLEESISIQFGNPDPTRKWREGVSKSSFTYLLLDPRITQNLPCRAETMSLDETWKTFVSAIFYVGKGKRSRPYSHLYEAVGLWNQGKSTSSNKKLQTILDVWNSERSGVICLHIFQNVIPVEAYTREAAMISALDLNNLKNAKMGDFYGVAATWNQKQKKSLGVYLLYRAMLIFLNEGERQLRPADIE